MCDIVQTYTYLTDSRFAAGLCWHTESKQKTRTTVRLIAWDDMVSRHNILHAFSDRFYHSSCFMAKHTGEEALRVVAIKRVRIRVAQRSGYNLNTHFSSFWRSDVHVCYFQWLLCSPCHGSFASDGLTDRILYMKTLHWYN